MQPLQLRGLYDSSRYCLVLAGDIPHQTRFFRAVLQGCLPVVVTYHAGTAEESWWRDRHNVRRYADFASTDPGLPGAFVDSLPFTEHSR